jgi:hypothetical protein
MVSPNQVAKKDKLGEQKFQEQIVRPSNWTKSLGQIVEIGRKTKAEM